MKAANIFGNTLDDINDTLKKIENRLKKQTSDKKKESPQWSPSEKGWKAWTVEVTDHPYENPREAATYTTMMEAELTLDRLTKRGVLPEGDGELYRFEVMDIPLDCCEDTLWGIGVFDKRNTLKGFLKYKMKSFTEYRKDRNKQKT